MRATIEYIERKFDEYNNLCFGGKLPKPPFRISSARTFLGKINCIRKRNPDGTMRFSDFTFLISDATDLPENVLEDTIIHEMIHYYILVNQMQDNAPHGHLFRQIMAEINTTYHRHISISHKRTEEEYATDTERRQHLVCLSRLKNGTLTVTVCAGKARTLFSIWNEMERIPEIAKFKWFSTTDSYFNRFPRSLKAKFYRAPDDILPHLESVNELVRSGRVITVGQIKDLRSFAGKN